MTPIEHNVLVSLLLLTGCAIVTTAALSDIQTRMIPNWCSLATLAAGLLLRVLDHQLLAAACLAAALMSLGLIAWRLNVLGGGDVKLIAASSTLIPFPQSILFVPHVALSGGLLAVIYLAARPFAAGPGARTLPAPSGLPYGAAIAAGAFISLMGQ